MTSSTPPQDDVLNSLLGEFLDESGQLLAELNERMLQLDEWVQQLGGDHQEPCDPELLNEMFRAAHSLKGLSGMFGLTDIHELTHKIENVFDAARRNDLTVNADVTELVFMGIDQLTALVERLNSPDAQPVDCTAVVEAIRRLLQKAKVETIQTTQADAERAMQDVLPPHADLPSAGGGGGSDAAALAGPARGPSPDADPLADVENERDISDKYLSIFIDEAESSLEGLSAALLAGESGGTLDELNRMMSIAHKLKGSAASIGLNRIAKLAHLMEDVLEEHIDSGHPLSAGLADVLLKCTDTLLRHVAEMKQGVPQSDAFAPLARELLAARSAAAGEPASGQATYQCVARFEPSLHAAGLKAELICQRLDRLGALCGCEPPRDRLDEFDHLEEFRCVLTTDQPIDAVRGKLRVTGVAESWVEPVGAADGVGPIPAATVDRAARPMPETPMVGEAGGTEPANVPPVATPAEFQAGDDRPPPDKCPSGEGESRCESGNRPTETVRVDIEKLDHLMDLAGQLFTNRAQFAQIADRLRVALGSRRSMQALNRICAEVERISGQATLRLDRDHAPATLEGLHHHVKRVQNELELLRLDLDCFHQAHDHVEDLFEAIHQLGRVSDGIQQSVMDTRMVPIGPLFARFKRVVRDITRSTGKKARLEIRGENTELDKRMIDELGDPLVHLVRNSVDHGIELPEVRIAAGKSAEGTVELNAFHRGNSIVIEVRDDGKGLDPDRILRKALDKGLLTRADAEKMTAQQIYSLIWEPGLSTAEKITEVSGRGMGMDIVKSKIEELSGTADIASVPGRGTTITIKLPLTLAILPSLMVEIGGEVFAIPLEAVVEIVAVAAAQLSSIQGRQVAMVRGRVVSFVRLAELLAFHGEPKAATNETTLVIVSEGGLELGLAVDRVLGEEDVVIKSIAENYDNVRGIAGASILGDGRVSLILDIAALAAKMSRQQAAGVGT